uniref:RING-type domain-containing protein n=1 Tax=Panagrolaimus sp. PS1159 TaxID=55785 RepID=A0AC35GRC4_9BILA
MKTPKSDKIYINSSIFDTKKLPTSPFFAKQISSPRTSKELSKPIVSTNCDETTVEYICMICLEYLQPNNTSFTSCGHIFHQKCLNLWFISKAVQSCPLCRNDDIFGSELLPILPQSNEEKFEDFAFYNDFESLQQCVITSIFEILQQCVMTSIFEMWPISTLTKYHPKELFTMAQQSLEFSQKSFKSEQFLQAYRFLRRSIHFFDGILFCKNLEIFMRGKSFEYNEMEFHFKNLIEIFDLEFSNFFSKTAKFKEEIYLIEKYFIETCSSRFTFSL